MELGDGGPLIDEEVLMLRDNDAIATIPVKDIERARHFYQDTLGFELVENRENEVLSLKSGRSSILVYRSDFAGTNKATAATWAVGSDLDEIVQALGAKGVGFEHYEMPNTTLRGDVHVSDGMQVAWFKDPDENILCIVNG
jgi:catechol 2,3-dioxygenase-like lactoylglutathione lyase family enzyme